jgi:hypothetical protein
MNIDFKQATELLQLFGGEPAEIALMTGDGHSGHGLYAVYTADTDEGSVYLGETDENATPQAAPVAASSAQVQGEAVAWCDPSNPLNHEAFAWAGTLRQPRHSMPLYATPPPAQAAPIAAQPEPLTDEEIMELAYLWVNSWTGPIIAFVRAIEAAAIAKQVPAAIAEDKP